MSKSKFIRFDIDPEWLRNKYSQLTKEAFDEIYWGGYLNGWNEGRAKNRKKGIKTALEKTEIKRAEFRRCIAEAEARFGYKLEQLTFDQVKDIIKNFWSSSIESIGPKDKPQSYNKAIKRYLAYEIEHRKKQP